MRRGRNIVVAVLVVGLMGLTGLTGCTRVSRQEYQKLSDYKHEEGNFSVLLPGEPVWRFQLVQMTGGVHLAEATNPGIEYAIGYGDFMGGKPSAGQVQTVYVAARDAVVAESKGGKLMYTTETSVGHYRGMEFCIKMPGEEDNISKFRTFVVENRLYMIGVHGARSEVNSPDASRFFTSFRLLRPANLPRR